MTKPKGSLLKKKPGITKSQVLKSTRETLEERLKAHHLELKLKVEYVKKEDDWWYVTVEPGEEIEEAYPYYESLAEAEIALRRKKDLYVSIIPVI